MTETAASTERMNIVIVGHVDHGKSTVIGRLLADTDSLPEGKIEDVREMCRRNARPFEYAFLLDALKNEQAQGITIDTARCFFKTERRSYIVNDAPGHIEFLKNAVTGAARAEAALLVIDAQEGVQENSKRHGYMASMLGIKQLCVVVNKMDLVDYCEDVFNQARDEYTAFLDHLDVHPLSFIPVSAREGVNMTAVSELTPWFSGPAILEQIDTCEKPRSRAAEVFRMPVQDIYRFTEGGDDRRIVAGTIDTGTVAVGDEVVFHPSGKTSTVANIEGFYADTIDAPAAASKSAGFATGVTLTEQIYIKPGELMCRVADEPPLLGTRFRANLFWMGRDPMVSSRSYKLKLGAARVPVELAELSNVLDASELSSTRGKQQIDRHDVAECTLETLRPVAFDRRSDVEATGRFVIVDGHEIAGCGIILEQVTTGPSKLDLEIREREYSWDHGVITAGNRAGRRTIAKKVERALFQRGCHTYYLGIGTLFDELDREERAPSVGRGAHIRQLGELARVITASGVLFITTLTDVNDFDLEMLSKLNKPSELFVVNVGENVFSRFPIDVALPAEPDLESAVEKITTVLTSRNVLIEYYI